MCLIQGNVFGPDHLHRLTWDLLQHQEFDYWFGSLVATAYPSRSFSACLILVLWDPCQWDLCLPCYYALLLTSLPLQVSLLLLLPDVEILTISCNRYVNGVWRKENNAKYNRSLINIYLEWTQSPWQLDTEESLIYKEYFLYVHMGEYLQANQSLCCQQCSSQMWASC